MTDPIRHVAIVGANLAGGRAAEALRSEGFDGPITLIGEEPHRPYERPPLSKEILRGEWEPDKAFLQEEAWYGDHAIDLRLGARATRLDGTSVELDGPGADGPAGVRASARVDADAVVLCTGGRPRTLPIPGVDLPGVHTLRTIDDALAIRARLEPGAPVVVIGAGFIGAEVAASATQLGCAVTLLEVAPVPLGRALGPEVGEIYAAIHRERGVDLRTGAAVERIDGDATAGVGRVQLADGTNLDARAVILGVGITPNVELAEAAGIACDDGILVDERARTSASRVWAAGDVARHPNPILGERIRVEHWQNAQTQAAVAAASILGRDTEHREVPWFWSDQFELTMQMAGHPSDWDRIVYRGDVDTRRFAAFYLSGSRLVAALGVGRSKEVRGARALIEAGIELTPEELADDDVDLRARARAGG